MKRPVIATTLRNNLNAATISFLIGLLWHENAVHVHAHSRWKCPEPRNLDTGIKGAPCGPETNDFSLPSGQPIVEIAPGPLQVVFEESIYHTGSPFRISLTRESDDYNVCVLLDHIPHNDNPPSMPRFNDESSYVPYYITIEIPNVACDRCSLHLGNPMTDKIGGNGAPTGSGCTDPFGTCNSVYYSCTRPFRITGTNTMDTNWECPAALSSSSTGSNGTTTNTAWPQQWIGDNGGMVDTSVPGLYRREAGIWVDGYLQQVPEFYRSTIAGGICNDDNGDNGDGGTVGIVGVTTPSPSTSSSSSSSSSSRTTLAPSLFENVNDESASRQTSDAAWQSASVSWLLSMVAMMWGVRTMINNCP